MGLSLVVGILADLRENDEEGYEYFQQQFAAPNEFLRSSGLSEHNEPEDCEVWSCDMYGYYGLHYLRRIAAHLDSNGAMPLPGDNNSSEDDILRDYLRVSTGAKPSLVTRLFNRPPSHRFGFDHLIIHGDAEGFYLPANFEKVLFPPADLGIVGGMLGSSVKLLDECQRLAVALEIPADIDENSGELHNAPEMQGDAEVKWQRYGVESFTCIHLIKACKQSLQTGAAIVLT